MQRCTLLFSTSNRKVKKPLAAADLQPLLPRSHSLLDEKRSHRRRDGEPLQRGVAPFLGARAGAPNGFASSQAAKATAGLGWVLPVRSTRAPAARGP